MRSSTILFLVAATAGCTPRQAVQVDQLPLRRVAIYRNGVGYFERAGRVDTDAVRFQVRGNEIGDFLASFAVIERGGSSVRSASFPLKVEDPAPIEPGTKPIPHKVTETVVMSLDGKQHDLQVGYIAATPVWRPSYRLVVEEKDADLQAWGIIENLSGEDWKNVSLSLIAGAPLAFEATLGTPVIPVRPTVTDGGEVIAAVPHGENTLAQGFAPMTATAAAPPPPPAEVEEEVSLDSLGGGGGYGRGSSDAKSYKKSAPKKNYYAPAPSVAPMPRYNPSAPRNLSALAAVAVEAGATRYDVPNAVTVPDKTATMVLLLSRHVPGEAVFLFAPDGGVPDSASHPFRVARFTNASGGLLERGPIAIFEAGNFLGQGLLDPLPDGASATVPFALERSLAVDSTRTRNDEGARVKRIEASTLTIERDAVELTKYRVRNGGEKPAHVEIRHPRSSGWRLVKPPPGTKDNVGNGNAIVPTDVAGRATAEFTVEERQAAERTADWLSSLADEAVRAYLNSPKADPQTRNVLAQAWTLRDSLVRVAEERKKLTDEQNELQTSTEETRNNLKSIEKNHAAADLRARLTDRLSRASARLDEITKRMVEIDMQMNEQRVRFQDLLRTLKLSVPSAE
jgi:hypothetical protein